MSTLSGLLNRLVKPSDLDSVKLGEVSDLLILLGRAIANLLGEPVSFGTGVLLALSELAAHLLMLCGKLRDLPIAVSDGTAELGDLSNLQLSEVSVFLNHCLQFLLHSLSVTAQCADL